MYCRDFPKHYGFHNILQLPLNSRYLYLHSIPQPYVPSLSLPDHPIHIWPASCQLIKPNLFPPPRKIQVSLLESSSIPNLSGSTFCRMVIIYLMNNIANK